MRKNWIAFITIVQGMFAFTIMARSGGYSYKDVDSPPTNSVWFTKVEGFKWLETPSESFAALASNLTLQTGNKVIITAPANVKWRSIPITPMSINAISLLFNAAQDLMDEEGPVLGYATGYYAPLFLSDSTCIFVAPQDEIFASISMRIEVLDKQTKARLNDVAFSMEDGFVHTTCDRNNIHHLIMIQRKRFLSITKEVLAITVTDLIKPVTLTVKRFGYADTSLSFSPIIFHQWDPVPTLKTIELSKAL